MVFNREYQVRASRLGRKKYKRLEGVQLELKYPVRGRPTKHRILERCGQMRLDLASPHTVGSRKTAENRTSLVEKVETLDDALQMTFLPGGRPGEPVQSLSDDELTAEFDRLFPPEGDVRI